MDDTQPTQIIEDETDFGEIAQRAVRVAKRRFLWILLTGLGTLVAAVIVLSFVPDVYSSESTILVVEQQIPQNMVAPLSAVMGTQKLQAMTQDVLSRSRLLKIIDETHLFADKKLSPDVAVERMRKSIGIVPDAVGRDGSFGSFIISFSAATPGLAQEVTRRLASLFIERHSESQVSRANSTKGFLKERLAEKRKRLGDLEQQVRNFKIQHAGALPDSRMGNETRMAEYRTQLQNTLSNLNRAKQQRVVWESMLSGNLSARLTRLKAERAALLPRFTPKHPEIVRRDEEIDLIERMLGNVQAGVPVSGEQLGRFVSGDTVVSQLQGQLDANRLEAESLAKDQKRFEGMITDAQVRLNMTPALEQQLTSMVRESETLNQEIINLDRMDQQSELSADMERQQQGEQFRQIDAPALPLKPLSPARFKISAGAAVGGMVLGFGLALLLDIRRKCFQTERQILRKFSPPLVVSIPELLTPRETRTRKWLIGLECVAGFLVTVALVAVQFYVYKHS